METSTSLQLITLHAKGWFSQDILMDLLSKYIYGFKINKRELTTIVLREYSSFITDRIKENNYQHSDILFSFITDLKQNIHLYNTVDIEESILFTIYKNLKFSNIKLARFDFKLIGIKNYGNFTLGLTYKELNSFMDKSKWEGYFTISKYSSLTIIK